MWSRIKNLRIVRQIIEHFTHQDRDWITKKHLGEIINRQEMDAEVDKKGSRWNRDTV